MKWLKRSKGYDSLDRVRFFCSDRDSEIPDILRSFVSFVYVTNWCESFESIFGTINIYTHTHKRARARKYQ